eukprot:CAMPEP_0176190738 /NCGR_PEP_ID=MMETSP0121_2-20121125/4097_1 /TAXON_ID=160619 /ORGANISM="Kryptoperidinium foliaceum, Strain CCMP 1326" /LENGTH=177 /DNA_ID=CAMNT_0017529377 /DNA_START=747 /DNA_END=1280 /DNA_ORIENTATION=-
MPDSQTTGFQAEVLPSARVQASEETRATHLAQRFVAEYLKTIRVLLPHLRAKRELTSTVRQDVKYIPAEAAPCLVKVDNKRDRKAVEDDGLCVLRCQNNVDADNTHKVVSDELAEQRERCDGDQRRRRRARLVETEPVWWGQHQPLLRAGVLYFDPRHRVQSEYEMRQSAAQVLVVV